MTELTQDELKRLLHYEPATGIFTWLVRTTNSVKVGSIAGTLHKHGYIHIRINKKRYQAHRLAFLYMTGEFPEKGLEVDHMNHDRSDNSWINLRIVTAKENMRNSSTRKDNTSGCVGVSWNKLRCKWQARIMDSNGNYMHLGLFKKKEDSIAARKAAEIEYGYHKNHGKQINQN